MKIITHTSYSSELHYQFPEHLNTQMLQEPLAILENKGKTLSEDGVEITTLVHLNFGEDRSVNMTLQPVNMKADSQEQLTSAYNEMQQTIVSLGGEVLDEPSTRLYYPPGGRPEDIAIFQQKVKAQEALKRRFNKLAKKWKDDTQFVSSVETLITHPAYVEIINMGKDILPYMFKRLQKHGEHWFFALQKITGADPINPEDAGRVKEMTAAWLNWGRVQGYIE